MYLIDLDLIPNDNNSITAFSCCRIRGMSRRSTAAAASIFTSNNYTVSSTITLNSWSTVGGSGGGGNGTIEGSGTLATDGTDGLGGGGGGSSGHASYSATTKGGDGIVIVRYQV